MSVFFARSLARMIASASSIVLAIGFSTKDVLAGREGLFGQPPVRPDRRGDADRVDRGIGEQLAMVPCRAHRGKALVDRFQPLIGKVGHGDGVGTRRFVEVADEVGTPVPRADDRDAKALHSVRILDVRSATPQAAIAPT
jgi:hypothetical protein